MKLLVQGAESVADVPGIDSLPGNIETFFAKDGKDLEQELPGSEIMLLWDFKNRDLQELWHKATDLKWIQWCGAGVDGVLFDALRHSDVILTNARGIFDRQMAETVLGYMLMVTKDFQTTLKHQENKTWQYRKTRMLKGESTLIVGVGSIGREIARLLSAVGMQCFGAGRQARAGDEIFKKIYASNNITSVIGQFDWVVGILPSTAETTGFFGKEIFTAMRSDAYFINLGRGSAVVEPDIIDALESETIAGAMLDVFCTEPLEQSDPMWKTKNLFVSPHMSGDYDAFEKDLVLMFKNNLNKYLTGQPMSNIVDKKLGFVRS